jgi:hypothetical protein
VTDGAAAAGDRFAARAEVMKLSRLLGRDPESLSYLESVPVDDLVLLRDRVTDRLFDAQGGALGRLAGASRVLPTGLLATLGERTFGPLLCARFAALIEPARAVDVAAKLPLPFLADVAIELDPRRASDVIARIPAEQVAAVAGELARRGEYVTVGRFVGFIGPDALSKAAAAIDDQGLLSVAFVLENTDGLDALADVIGVERLVGLVRAAEESGRWAEGLNLLAMLSPDRRRAIIDSLTDSERSRLADRAREAGLGELASMA